MHILFIKKCLFICLRQVLAVAHGILDLHCGTWDLYLHHVNSQLQHVGSSSPDQGLNLGLLHWEHRILAAGPPGKSPRVSFRLEWKHNQDVAGGTLGTVPGPVGTACGVCPWVLVSCRLSPPLIKCRFCASKLRFASVLTASYLEHISVCLSSHPRSRLMPCEPTPAQRSLGI